MNFNNHNFPIAPLVCHKESLGLVLKCNRAYQNAVWIDRQQPYGRNVTVALHDAILWFSSLASGVVPYACSAVLQCQSGCQAKSNAR